jgi:hydroxymethylpyrimidine/phosphomethylpyrimidine kinase
MKTALTIAGSDSIGGAGIQADIKTMTVNGVYAMSAITALTAQNTMGVTAISTVTPQFLQQQIDAVFSDIRPDAVKIGMVATPELIHVIAERLTFYQADCVVIDPVMVATSGASLLSDAGRNALGRLLSLGTLLTPNLPEAELLTGTSIRTKEDMCQAAQRLGATYDCAVLCKGGHRIEDADDLLYTAGKFHWLQGERIDNPNTHGTGCTLSSAIAANLAKGASMLEAVTRGKAYITGALKAQLDLGHGAGPLNHAWPTNVPLDRLPHPPFR